MKKTIDRAEVSRRALAAEDAINALGITGQVWTDDGRANVSLDLLEALIERASQATKETA